MCFLSEAVRGERWHTERENSQPIRSARSLLWSCVRVDVKKMLLLCSCLQEIKLDYSWQHHIMYRDSGPHPSNCRTIKSEQKVFVLSLRDRTIIEPWLHLVTMWSLYRPEPLLKSSNHSWCFTVQSVYEHVGPLKRTYQADVQVHTCISGFY